MEKKRENNSDFKSRKNVSGIFNDDRPMPHDVNLEKAVLGAMLLEPQPSIDHAIEIFGEKSVFYSPAHKEIYKCITQLYKEERNSVELVSVSHALKSKGTLDDVGGEAYLVELESSVVTTANIESWCRLIKDYCILREMILACHESLNNCFEAKDNIGEVIETVEKSVFSIRESEIESDITSMKDLAPETFEYFDDLYHQRLNPGIPTGFHGLDKKIIGLKPGEMFVLAARPSIGKTSLALNVIRNIALNPDKPRPVAFFSLEMTSNQVARRLLCTEANIAEKDVYERTITAIELSRFTRAADIFMKSEIYIDATPALKIGQLRAKARRMKSKHNIELIVIDYMQLMHSDVPNESRQQEVSEISHGVKALAKELNLPVLVLAQLNREIEKGTGRPKLSHLRESGAIEQDADVVTFLHREREHQKDISKEAQVSGLDAQLIIEKNRNGETGIIDLLFFPKRMLFGDKSRYDEEYVPKP